MEIIMKNMFLTTLLLISAAENICSERFAAASQAFSKYIVPHAGTIAAGSLAALKFAYNHATPQNLLYLTSLAQQIAPYCFPGRQLGVLDPEGARTWPYDCTELNELFFDQWDDIRELIKYLTKKIKPNSEKENIENTNRVMQIKEAYENAALHTINTNGASSASWFQEGGWLKSTATKIASKLSVKAIADTLNRTPYKPNLDPSKYGYILQGPPGCGKTSLPIYLARTLHCPLYTISADKLSTGYSGATVTNFKNVIEAAYKAASKTSNKVAIVTLEDVDTLFRVPGPEMTLLQTFLLDFIQKMQSGHQTEQRTRKAEILFFCTCNYNKSEWLSQGSLSREGRLQKYDYKSMSNKRVNDETLLKNKIELSVNVNNQQNNGNRKFVKMDILTTILSNNTVHVKKNDLHKILFPNTLTGKIQEAATARKRTIENVYKATFNEKYPNLQVSSITESRKNIPEDDDQLDENTNVPKYIEGTNDTNETYRYRIDNKGEEEYTLTFDPIQYDQAVNFLGRQELKRLIDMITSIANDSNELIYTAQISEAFYATLFQYLNAKQIKKLLLR